MIADLSVNHAEKMFLLTFDAAGYMEPDLIYVQMKASDAPDYSQAGDFVTVRVDDRDDITWRTERNPVILIIYDAEKDAAFYVDYQTLPRTTRRSVRIPTTNRFDKNAAEQIRVAKNNRLKGLT